MKIRQIINILIIFATIVTWAGASENLTPEENKLILSALGVHGVRIARAPANFIPEDDVEVSPFEQTLWIERAMKEDNAGILNQMKDEIKDWQVQREYIENWNLESTGLYYLPERDRQVRYVEKHLLKYFDKRLSGEIKRAEEGSTWHKVGKARQALKPSGTVGVSKLIKIKFRAKVLLRQARILVINPWVKLYMYADTYGDMRMHMRREFKTIGVFANLDYDIDDKYYKVSFSKKLMNNIYGTLSSQQAPSEMAFTQSADTILQFNYYRSF